MKTFLKEYEGVICNSPKSCMRELFKNKYITQEQLIQLFKIVDARNLIVHIYNEDLANELFEDLNDYLKIIKDIFFILKQYIS